jgi:CHAT domain-containing protein/tetratricopeptide (TPR) repeat protein
MKLPVKSLSEESPIDHLLELPNQSSRRSFLRQNPDLLNASTVQQLYGEVLRLARVDLNRAEVVAKTLSMVASKLGDEYGKAISLRALGHVNYLTGKHEKALQNYETALNTFRRLEDEVEVGRTCIGALQTLIYLSKYDKAMAWGRLARGIFGKRGDKLRLARLDTNMGNVLYRQDRFQQALRLYTRAYEEFQQVGEPSDIAIALRNIAVCRISLNQFSLALKTYYEARRYSSEHDMPLLVAECDYNIAYLFYLRGQYTAAMKLYEVAREHCERVGDRYHMALCDLDGSELYLELNLITKSIELAKRASSSFRALRMRYEAAKALTNLAVATAERGEHERAVQLLVRARNLFERERNLFWMSQVDLYQSVVLFRSGKYMDSRRLCESALDFFRRESIPSRAALCETVLGRLHLQAGDLVAAKRTCERALRRLKRTETPGLSFNAWFVLGQVNERLGRDSAAERSYAKAHRTLEQLRSQLRTEEPKMSFPQKKLVVYENLVRLCVEGSKSASTKKSARAAAAFSYMEHAKSRSLADLLSFRAQGLAGSSKRASVAIERVRDLREELNWTYKRIDLHDLERSSQRTSRQTLREHARNLENELTKALSALSRVDEEYASLQSASIADLEQIRSILPQHTILLNYYPAGEVMYVALLGRDILEVVPLAPTKQILEHLDLLQFQLSKYHLAPDYLKTFSTLFRTATEEHLRALYADLLSPIRKLLKAEHLVIAPHDVLHRIPFHALLDQERYLIDDFSVSYIPSGTVMYLCSLKVLNCRNRSLVMGIPDAMAPEILSEANVVAATLPKARLFIGPDATMDRLRRYGPESRYVHIATHGLFREDNPLFSSIRLGDSQLHLFDLYDLQLKSELVTLSGCGTGLNVVVTGDELLGLVRGLLYAGSQAVLATLWDVHDKSTAEFMEVLYRTLTATSDKRLAFRTATKQIREQYRDVYYWAPFVLIGKVF